MSYSQSTTFGHAPSSVSQALRRLGAELGALSDALLMPGQLQREVDRFAALRSRAQRVEARDPALAAKLRAQAARVLS